MKSVVLHVLVTLSVILQVQVAAAVLIADKADIATAADEGDLDLVLLHLIADPASANQRNDEYDTQTYKNIRPKCIHHVLFCVQRSKSGILSGTTPLHTTAYTHSVLCQFLVEKGANVNATDNRCDNQPFTYTYEHLHVNVCFVCDVVILVFSEETHRCIRLLKSVGWTFASFS
jgi:hypothetical protein